MSILIQLDHLIRLALVDHDFSLQERQQIMAVAKANKIPEEEVNNLIEQHLNSKEEIAMEIPSLSSDERFEYLYNIVQLMKIDSEIFLSEIRFCENMAVKLGYNKKVISELSKRIYSDPTITADRDRLRKIVEKFYNN